MSSTLCLNCLLRMSGGKVIDIINVETTKLY